MFYAEKLSGYIRSLNYNEIPNEAINKAKQCIIDSIGCTIAGSRFESGKILIKTLSKFDSSSESVIWGTNERSSLLMSVFINSVLANAMDFDDNYFPAGPRSAIHPGATIIPPAFSLGEYLQSNGRELLEAIIAGYEIENRIAEALVPSDEQNKKIRGLGTLQTFGALTVGAKLLSLNGKEISNAFGIAGTNAPVACNRKVWGNEELGVTMVKNNYGTASFSGVLSALLAKNGFTGPTNIFEGETGFWRMSGSDQFFPERLEKDLGKEYRIMNVSFKTYPCGIYMHSSIDAVLKTIRLYGIEAKEIDSILVKAHPFVAEILSRRHPKNPIHATFSLPFLIGLEIFKLPYGFEEHFRENMENKDVLRIMEIVKVEGYEPKEKKNKEYYPAKAIIKVGNKTYSGQVDYPSGSTMNPMSDDQFKEKFFKLTENQLGRKNSQKLLETLVNIETVKNIKKEITQVFFS